MFGDYASHHRTQGNKRMHRLGIPLIVFSLIGLLARIGIASQGAVRIDAALVLIAAATVFYLFLEWRLAILMLIVMVPMYLGARMLPPSVNWVLFVGGWILQFVGHSVYEKRQPAFLNNLVHLLVGPLWVLNDIIPVVRPQPVKIS